MAREATVALPAGSAAVAVLGQQDALLQVVERELGATLVVRGDTLVVRGTEEQVEAATRLLEELVALAQDGETVTPADVRRAIRDRATPPGQTAYVEAIRAHDLTFAIGPAGTGKTYLAVAMAVLALRAKAVQRIVWTRPAIWAGEKLGFLPGDVAAQGGPYLRAP